MKFLIVFIALMLQWRLPLPQRSPESRTFVRWLQLWHKLSAFSRLHRHLKFTLVVLLPACLATAAFYYSEALAWGLVTFVLEIALLLYVLMHADTKQHLDHYREQLLNKDLQGAFRCAERHLALPEAGISDDVTTMNEQVIKALLHRWFEYFFLMVFWYMVADVGGILLAWLSVQYARATHCDERSCQYLHLVEWIPVRLLGLTFGLAGNMTRSLPVWKHYLWHWHANSADVLYAVASRALADSAQQREWHSAGDDAEAAAAELQEWQQLHLRCVSVWMVMIAAATVGGWLL